MLKYGKLNNLAAFALAAVILCVYAAALLSAQMSFSIFPALVEYQEDINKDGQVDVSDAVSLIILGRKISNSPVSDYNGDSLFNIVDVVTLLLNIKNSRLTPLIPQDTSGKDTTSSDTTSNDTTGTQTYYLISGYVYCLYGGWPNIQIFLAGDMEATTFTDNSGFYSFQVPDGSYTIIPLQLTGYGFNPLSRAVIINGSDLQRLDFFMYGYESLPDL